VREDGGGRESMGRKGEQKGRGKGGMKGENKNVKEREKKTLGGEGEGERRSGKAREGE